LPEYLVELIDPQSNERSAEIITADTIGIDVDLVIFLKKETPVSDWRNRYETKAPEVKVISVINKACIVRIDELAIGQITDEDIQELLRKR
jgi:hypothetical protein